MGGSAFVGRVVSNRMQKTVVVAVDYVVWRPKLKVYEKRTSKHFAHDEAQACDIGDLVRIRRIARRSKRKHYNVTEVLRKVNVYSPALGAAAAADAAAAAASPATRTDLARAQFEASEARLQKLLQLREAYAQDAAGVQQQLPGGGSGASSSSSSDQASPAGS